MSYIKCFYRDFAVNFDGNNWGNNGPGVITRVLRGICKTDSTPLMLRSRCHGFNVFPAQSFYAIKWRNWDYFTEPEYLHEALNITKDSYIVHVWNKFSMDRPIQVGSKVAYGILANEFCPKVYNNCGQYF